MVFRPVNPRPVECCNCHICTIQGLFLKRQDKVSELYAKMVTENFLNFPLVIEYLGTLPLWEDLKAAYTEQNALVLRETMGSVAVWLGELVLGQEKYKKMEN